jgi:flagellum-specific peptidoglycan hydrolase FlgJ
MVDHAAFFKANARYAACFKEKTGEGWARAVAKAGYATDPTTK